MDDYLYQKTLWTFKWIYIYRHVFFLKAAISNAKSLEEVQKLEMLLKTGHVPDSEGKANQDETMVVDGT